jgi:hypothetical protein
LDSQTNGPERTESDKFCSHCPLFAPYPHRLILFRVIKRGWATKETVRLNRNDTDQFSNVRYNVKREMKRRYKTRLFPVDINSHVDQSLQTIYSQIGNGSSPTHFSAAWSIIPSLFRLISLYDPWIQQVQTIYVRRNQLFSNTILLVQRFTCRPPRLPKVGYRIDFQVCVILWSLRRYSFPISILSFALLSLFIGS